MCSMMCCNFAMFNWTAGIVVRYYFADYSLELSTDFPKQFFAMT